LLINFSFEKKVMLVRFPKASEKINKKIFSEWMVTN